MASFQLCYDLNKHTSDRDSILVLHPASWPITAIGPLVRENICGIVTYDIDALDGEHPSQINGMQPLCMLGRLLLKELTRITLGYYVDDIIFGCRPIEPVPESFANKGTV
jgi:hypothetical protein